MYNPNENRFEPLDQQLMDRFTNAQTSLTEQELVQRDWTRFSEDEVVSLKGLMFRIAEVGETRLVLRPIR